MYHSQEDLQPLICAGQRSRSEAGIVFGIGGFFRSRLLDLVVSLKLAGV